MNRITIRPKEAKYKINRHIYGHFAEHLGRCIYDGLYVGENSPVPNIRGFRNDIITALKAINIPNLRWPGGCFADQYHWRDGIGPKENRQMRLNMWGNEPEPNLVGTHEFLDLCEQLGCAPYIGGNLGSGTVEEMRDWVEYLTSDHESSLAKLRRQNGREKAWEIPFFGIGNENWGCGGYMSPEHYANLYSQFYGFVRNYGETPMMKIAAGMGGSEPNGVDNSILLEKVLNRRHHASIEGISIHYYVFLPEKKEHSATKFGKEEWFFVLHEASRIEQVIKQNAAVLDKYDPDKKIWLIVDEWGTWYPAEEASSGILYQQNSMRDALVAALTLHIFQSHCERVQMANIAQTVNVLQALFLTRGEQMILTPTYHVFEMFKDHMDALHLPTEIESESYISGEKSLPAFSASASQSNTGEILLTIANLKPDEAIRLECQIEDIEFKSATGRILQAEAINTFNNFEEPERVKPSAFTGMKQEGNQLIVTIPPASVLALKLI